MSKNTCPKGHYEGAAHMMTGGSCIRCGWEDPVIRSITSPALVLQHPVDAERNETLKTMSKILEVMSKTLDAMNERLIRLEASLAARKRRKKPRGTP